MAPAPFKIIIVGAGPAGLATALTLLDQRKNDTTKSSSPLHITLLERRDSVQTLGGAINLTPLALRYLDSLGAGKALREASSPVSAIELVGHRLGNLLVKLWPGVDAIRILRQTLVEGLLTTLKERASSSSDDKVSVVYGAKITTMEQFGPADSKSEGVRIVWTEGGNEHTADAHLLIGCDGIHSQVRTALVDPDRKKTYAGRSNAYGYAKVTPEEAAKWTRADGQPLITDTTLVQNGGHSLLVTYFQQPEHRDAVYLAAITPTPEPAGGSREGWSVLGADKEGIKQSILDNYKNGPLTCLPDILDRCQEWFFFPVYMLSPGGRWSNGRVQLLGDAAHAVSFSLVHYRFFEHVLTECFRCLHRARAQVLP